MSAALVAGLASANAQVVAADSVMQHANGKRLSIGGYGEVAFSRNFYSDSGNRYSSASLHKDDPSHGRFDIPHAVIYLGYDFGKLFLEILRHFRRVVKPFFVEERHKGVHNNGPAGAYSMVDRHHFAPAFFVLDQFRREDTDINLFDADLWDCYCHLFLFFPQR